MIASVSPAVVVPCLFRLRDVGYGVSKGIPTLVLAATAIDDSISVAVFAIILNAMFSTGSPTFNIIKVLLLLVSKLLYSIHFDLPISMHFTGTIINSCWNCTWILVGSFVVSNA